MKSVIKILVITDICLGKEYHAGIKNGVLSLIGNMTKISGVEVSVLSFHYRKPDELDSFDVKCYWYPDFLNLFVRKLKSFLSINTSLLEYKKSIYKSHLVKKITKKNRYDVCIIEYLENSFLLDSVQGEGVRKICDIQDIMTFRKESFLRGGGKLPPDENLDISIKDELNEMAKYDCILTIEDSEFNYLKDKLDNEVILFKKFPIVSDNYKCNKVVGDKSIRIGFLGGGAAFNVDSINSFIKNVWNLGLYNKNFELTVAGSVCSGLHDNIKGKFEIMGLIDTTQEFYSIVDISINPILYGSGLKMKNAETLLYGTPLITNYLGGKGFSMVDQHFCQIIDMTSINAFVVASTAIISRMATDLDYQGDCILEAKKHFSPEACFKDLKQYVLC
jgi:hypothetical protein